MQVIKPLFLVSFSFCKLEPKILSCLGNAPGQQADVLYGLSLFFFVYFVFSFANGKFNLKHPSQSFLETKLLSAFLLSLLPSLESVCVCVCECECVSVSVCPQ